MPNRSALGSSIGPSFGSACPPSDSLPLFDRPHTPPASAVPCPPLGRHHFTLFSSHLQLLIVVGRFSPAPFAGFPARIVERDGAFFPAGRKYHPLQSFASDGPVEGRTFWIKSRQKWPSGPPERGNPGKSSFSAAPFPSPSRHLPFPAQATKPIPNVILQPMPIPFGVGHVVASLCLIPGVANHHTGPVSRCCSTRTTEDVSRNRSAC